MSGKKTVTVTVRMTPQDYKNLAETVRKTGDPYLSSFILRILRMIMEPQDEKVVKTLHKKKFHIRLAELLADVGLHYEQIFLNNTVIIRFRPERLEHNVINEDY